jgi:hypothetical protein
VLSAGIELEVLPELATSFDKVDSPSELRNI